MLSLTRNFVNARERESEGGRARGWERGRATRIGDTRFIYIFFASPKGQAKERVKGKSSSDLLKRRSLVNLTRGIYKGALLKGREEARRRSEALQTYDVLNLSEFSSERPFAHKHARNIDLPLASITQASTVAPFARFLRFHPL